MNVNTAVVAMMLVSNSIVEYIYVPFISSMCSIKLFKMIELAVSIQHYMLQEAQKREEEEQRRKEEVSNYNLQSLQLLLAFRLYIPLNSYSYSTLVINLHYLTSWHF
jgi:phosphate/sulfate permease